MITSLEQVPYNLLEAPGPAACRDLLPQRVQSTPLHGRSGTGYDDCLFLSIGKPGTRSGTRYGTRPGTRSGT